MRILIKKIYMLMIMVLNIIFKPKKINRDHVVVMMTFKQDVFPIIEALSHQGYNITVVGKVEDQAQLKNLKNIMFKRGMLQVLSKNGIFNWMICSHNIERMA